MGILLVAVIVYGPKKFLDPIINALRGRTELVCTKFNKQAIRLDDNNVYATRSAKGAFAIPVAKLNTVYKYKVTVDGDLSPQRQQKIIDQDSQALIMESAVAGEISYTILTNDLPPDSDNFIITMKADDSSATDN